MTHSHYFIGEYLHSKNALDIYIKAMAVEKYMQRNHVSRN